ncbi:type II toxin-antitoxin system Phd/YefM family antitoxin [Thermoflexus hugenholtzii]
MAVRRREQASRRAWPISAACAARASFSSSACINGRVGVHRIVAGLRELLPVSMRSDEEVLRLPAPTRVRTPGKAFDILRLGGNNQSKAKAKGRREDRMAPVRIEAHEARNRFAGLLRRVDREGQMIIVERSGRPMAVIIPFQIYERLIAERELRFRTLDRIRSRLPEVAPEEIERDIEDAIASVRSACAESRARHQYLREQPSDPHGAHRPGSE